MIILFLKVNIQNVFFWQPHPKSDMSDHFFLSKEEKSLILYLFLSVDLQKYPDPGNVMLSDFGSKSVNHQI